MFTPAARCFRLNCNRQERHRSVPILVLAKTCIFFLDENVFIFLLGEKCLVVPRSSTQIENYARCGCPVGL